MAYLSIARLNVSSLFPALFQSMSRRPPCLQSFRSFKPKRWSCQASSRISLGAGSFFLCSAKRFLDTNWLSKLTNFASLWSHGSGILRLTNDILRSSSQESSNKMRSAGERTLGSSVPEAPAMMLSFMVSVVSPTSTCSSDFLDAADAADASLPLRSRCPLDMLLPVRSRLPTEDLLPWCWRLVSLWSWPDQHLAEHNDFRFIPLEKSSSCFHKEQVLRVRWISHCCWNIRPNRTPFVCIFHNASTQIRGWVHAFPPGGLPTVFFPFLRNHRNLGGKNGTWFKYEYDQFWTIPKLRKSWWNALEQSLRLQQELFPEHVQAAIDVCWDKYPRKLDLLRAKESGQLPAVLLTRSADQGHFPGHRGLLAVADFAEAKTRSGRFRRKARDCHIQLMHSKVHETPAIVEWCLVSLQLLFQANLSVPLSFHDSHERQALPKPPEQEEPFLGLPVAHDPTAGSQGFPGPARSINTRDANRRWEKGVRSSVFLCFSGSGRCLVWKHIHDTRAKQQSNQQNGLVDSISSLKCMKVRKTPPLACSFWRSSWQFFRDTVKWINTPSDSTRASSGWVPSRPASNTSRTWKRLFIVTRCDRKFHFQHCFPSFPLFLFN